MLLEKIAHNVNKFGEKTAIHSMQGKLSYRELWDMSDRLACWIDNKLGEDKKPIVVYGHKNPWMIVCFFACVKSGRAYCPVDVSMAEERVSAIAKAVDNSLILATESLSLNGYEVAQLDTLKQAVQESDSIGSDKWVKGEDTYYIIFTSGSTGEPKGVKITEENLTNFTQWSVSLSDSEDEKSAGVFMNQAPFSFDLSVMDLYTSLVSGGTLWCVDKKTQKETGALLEYLHSGNINYWVSTPSFAEMCLADMSFDEKLLPGLRAFLFCGEKLTNETAGRLRNRFKSAKILNTYGPTESTVAVTEVVIDDEMISSKEALPIGSVKPGTEIRIVKEDGTLAEDGEKGEILIYGNTVSSGYFNDVVRTDKAFGCDTLEDDTNSRYYRTGDEGYKRGDMFYYSGRIDLQVKLHGYRIELGDIESNLIMLPNVESAAVIPQISEEGKIRYLAAFVTGDDWEGTFQDRKLIRTGLKERLPEYMVPKKVIFLKSLPMTNNGKTDRKKLEEYL